MMEDRDLERERDELLRFINEDAEEPVRRALTLVPERPQEPQGVVVAISTEGTGNARKE